VRKSNQASADETQHKATADKIQFVENSPRMKGIMNLRSTMPKPDIIQINTAGSQLLTRYFQVERKLLRKRGTDILTL
jgi:hypothetical protein